MNLLYANDARGKHAPSYYAATTTAPDLKPALRGRITADLCVVGGGYTGLTAALLAAQAGLDVVLVDAQRVGWGASGRNGGQLGSGFNMDQRALEHCLGKDSAHQLWDMALDAKELTRSLCAEHAPDAGYTPGVLEAYWQARDLPKARDYARHLHEHYGYDALDALDRDACHAATGTRAYHGGVLDRGAGHLHPLRYALGLARAAADAGVRIFEQTAVHHIEHTMPATLHCDHGQITAEHVIIATNGYGTGLSKSIASHVMPINNFVVATEPLSEHPEIMRGNIAVADSKFVVNYFRKSTDNRLIFGGGENYSYRFPKDIAAKVRPAMTQVYPQLASVKIDYAWGGTLAITTSRLPHLCRPAPNILSASGYSGHGLALAGFAGRLMALAVTGQTAGFASLEALPTGRFPGAGALRHPLLVLAMSWYALRDRIGL